LVKVVLIKWWRRFEVQGRKKVRGSRFEEEDVELMD